MEIKINQINAAEHRHGYWKVHTDDDVIYEVHYFNSKAVGYCEIYEMDNNIKYKIHFKGFAIGCLQCNSSQCFHNKPGNKFGEEIKWI